MLIVAVLTGSISRSGRSVWVADLGSVACTGSLNSRIRF